jgi:cell division protein FtsW (lipid II flippase)
MKKSRRSKVSLKLAHPKADLFLIILVLGLTVFGLIMLGNVSVVEAYRDFNDKLYYLKLQLQWAGIGLLGFVLATFFDYRKLKKLAIPLLLFSLLCLALVLIPGFGVKVSGAQRWLEIGAFRFQPAELAKLSFVLEAASSLIQIIAIRVFKRRVFKVAPFHHHLEAVGWEEPKVVARAWLAGLMLAIIGIWLAMV